VVGAGDRHFAGLDRLAQAVEDLRLKLRYYGANATGDLTATVRSFTPKGVDK
jgi:hypothetical protein